MIISGLTQHHDISDDDLEKFRIAASEFNAEALSELEAEPNEFDIESLIDDLETLFRELLGGADIEAGPDSD